MDGDRLYSAVDANPSAARTFAGCANVRDNPAVALLVDHYEDDWTALWWARADGDGRVLEPADDQARRGVELLVARYPQYLADPPSAQVLVVDVVRWSGWAAAPS